MDLQESIDELLRAADPDGPNHEKLLKLREIVVRGTMLGPKSMRYIHELIQKRDNIECVNLTGRDGMCNVPGNGECKHAKFYRNCPEYQPAKPGSKKAPLADIGVGG